MGSVNNKHTKPRARTSTGDLGKIYRETSCVQVRTTLRNWYRCSSASLTLTIKPQAIKDPGTDADYWMEPVVFVGVPLEARSTCLNLHKNRCERFSYIPSNLQQLWLHCQLLKLESVCLTISLQRAQLPKPSSYQRPPHRAKKKERPPPLQPSLHPDQLCGSDNNSPELENTHKPLDHPGFIAQS